MINLPGEPNKPPVAGAGAPNAGAGVGAAPKRPPLGAGAVTFNNKKLGRSMFYQICLSIII